MAFDQTEASLHEHPETLDKVYWYAENDSLPMSLLQFCRKGPTNGCLWRRQRWLDFHILKK